MTLRKAEYQDLEPLLMLYTFLHDNTLPEITDELIALWRAILNDPNHHILVGTENGRLVASCVLIIVPNLTCGLRPYALIENVITHPEHRGRGHAAKLMHHAKEIACERRCYKIMLMTGSKEESTLRFYKSVGYNTEDKTAFIQWLD